MECYLLLSLSRPVLPVQQLFWRSVAVVAFAVRIVCDVPFCRAIAHRLIRRPLVASTSCSQAAWSSIDTPVPLTDVPMIELTTAPIVRNLGDTVLHMLCLSRLLMCRSPRAVARDLSQLGVPTTRVCAPRVA